MLNLVYWNFSHLFGELEVLWIWSSYTDDRCRIREQFTGKSTKCSYSIHYCLIFRHFYNKMTERSCDSDYTLYLLEIV